MRCMKFSIHFLFRFFVLCVITFGVLTAIVTPVSAVDEGCAAAFPICFVSRPDDWQPGQCTTPTGSSCTLGTGRPGSACCSTTNPTPKPSVPSTPSSFDLCAQTSDPGKCNTCKNQYVDEDGKPVGLWTAIGCINPTKEGITTSAIKLGLGIGGGVVLLMILAASFKLTTSKGDPKATEEAKEMITNAIGGLLFILFSVVLIRTIGRGLLQIPGF